MWIRDNAERFDGRSATRHRARNDLVKQWMDSKIAAYKLPDNDKLSDGRLSIERVDMDLHRATQGGEPKCKAVDSHAFHAAAQHF